jgi:tetratricopeptide (TPR) repeat protein
LRYFEDAMQLARQYQYLSELGVILCGMGGTLFDSGSNHSETERYLQEGLLVSQQVGQRETLCYIYNNLGTIAEIRGEFARANAYFQQGQEQARQLQNPALLSMLLANQGDCLIMQHDYIQAREVLRVAIGLARQIKHADYLCYELTYLGKAIAYAEGYDRAIAYFQESLALAQQLSKPMLLVTLFVDWGEAALFHGQFSAAREHFQDVLTLDAEDQHYPNWQAHAHYGLAQIALHELNVEQAYEHATESLRLFQKVGHYKAQEVQAWLETVTKDRLMLFEQHQAAQEVTIKDER